MYSGGIRAGGPRRKRHSVGEPGNPRSQDAAGRTALEVRVAEGVKLRREEAVR